MGLYYDPGDLIRVTAPDVSIQPLDVDDRFVHNALDGKRATSDEVFMVIECVKADRSWATHWCGDTRMVVLDEDGELRVTSPWRERKEEIRGAPVFTETTRMEWVFEKVK